LKHYYDTKDNQHEQINDRINFMKHTSRFISEL